MEDIVDLMAHKELLRLRDELTRIITVCATQGYSAIPVVTSIAIEALKKSAKAYGKHGQDMPTGVGGCLESGDL